jgi:NAD(P)-dependent dehydrogenase (short-subunit alcohol dehydrogenase family)
MHDTVQLVLGGSGGIGAALARELGAAGARLVLAARDAGRLAAVAGPLGARAETVDALDPAAVDALVESVLTREGRLDGVAVCCGSILLKPLHLTSDEDFRATWERNVLPAFHATRAAVKAMQARGGSIVLFSSAAAETGLANHEAIAAAKSAVAALARSAAATYAARGIRVNALAPGLVRTPLAARITGSASALAASTALHPLGRIGEPEEVARAAAFLLDPRNSWITGQVLGVDGGLAGLRAR